MPTACQQNGDVRLLGGGPAEVNRGKLEVYDAAEGDWNSLCFDYNAIQAQEGVAQAACRQLGFSDFVNIGNVTKFE